MKSRKFTTTVAVAALTALTLLAAARPTGAATSQQIAEGQAIRLYSAYFLRAPDAAGLGYWVSQLQGGRTLQSVSQFFSESDEFEELYGALDDGEFIDLVYENVLDRSPDTGGRAHWVSGLGSGQFQRGGVMVGFSESPEFVKKTGTTPPTPPTTTTTQPPAAVYYASCAEARAAGAAPMYRGDPGYRPGLDRDNDGIACEVEATP